MDNYGLLQLESEWINLKLSSLQHIEIFTRHFELAEVLLWKQVKDNSVALALIKTYMGIAVPALTPPWQQSFVVFFNARSSVSL